MNRLLKFVFFTIFAAAFSVTALAQDLLPVPEYAAEVSAKAYAIATYGPAQNGEISVVSPLKWEDIGVDSYKIKFKIVRTGQVITWKPQFMCTPHCMNYEYPTALFNAARDGDKVKWWVSATVNGTVHQSVKMTAFVNEVDAPFSLSPSGNNVIARQNIHYLLWDMSDLAIKYTVVVKNANNGKIVLKQTLNSTYPMCDSIENVCKFVFGGANPTAESVFKHATPYKWYVIATGVSGEKAKSMVVRFRTAASIESQQ